MLSLFVDIQVFKAVNKPELYHLANCIGMSLVSDSYTNVFLILYGSQYFPVILTALAQSRT